MDTEISQILIIDDHPAFSKGLKALLHDILRNVRVFSASDAKSTLDQIKQNRFIDWIFLDVNLPDINGLELLEIFKQHKVIANIVIITSDQTPDIIDQALKKHVNGFLTKDFDQQILTDCLSTINRGKVYLNAEHTLILKNYRGCQLLEKQFIEEKLTHRQLQTLKLIDSGHSNREIADKLGLSESTVKTHVSALIALFDSGNRTQCIAKARRLHIIH